MKIRYIVVVAVLLSVLVQCESISPVTTLDEGSQCENLDWLQTFIDQAKQNDQAAEVIRYDYNGHRVYWVDTCKGCADAMAIVYNCSGQVICQFGGIAGFNTCPDFEAKATNRKVIWRN
jgi:hypothetical protein